MGTASSPECSVLFDEAVRHFNECACSRLALLTLRERGRERERGDGSMSCPCLPPEEGGAMATSTSTSMVNSAGLPMVRGHTGLYYCGRQLGIGIGAIPASDGQCGPNDGPQCADCRGCIAEDAANALAESINTFLSSSAFELAMDGLERRGYRIRGGFEALIRQAMEHSSLADSQGIIRLQRGSIDPNSEALLAILVNRISEDLRRMGPSCPLSIALEPSEASAQWTCPLCQQSSRLSSVTCPQPCGTNRKVIAAAFGTASSVFSSSRSLFRRCLSLHCGHNGEGTISLTERSLLIEEMAVFLRSRPLQELEAAGWLVAVPLAILLREALHGAHSPDHGLDHCFQDMENNSRAIYAILISQMQSDLSGDDVSLSPPADMSSLSIAASVRAKFSVLLSAHASRVKAAPPPTVAATAEGSNDSDQDTLFAPNGGVSRQESSSVCPICYRPFQNRSCKDCSIHSQVYSVASSMAVGVFREVERLFFRCVEMHSASSISLQSRTDLAREVNTFLGSFPLSELERCGWRVKHSVSCLMKASLSGAVEIPFSTGLADVNSIGLHAILVDRLRRRMPAQSVVTLCPPVLGLYGSVSMFNDPETNQPPVVTYNSTKFIEGNLQLLRSVAFEVSAGPNSDSRHWDGLSGQVFPQLERSGWTVGQAFRRMRQGERNLASLTSGVDEGSRGVIMAVHNLVRRMTGIEQREMEQAITPPSRPPSSIVNDSALPMATVRSVGKQTPENPTEATLHSNTDPMARLRLRLPVDEYKNVVKVAMKIVGNVKDHPDEKKYHKLKLDNPVVEKWLRPYPEAMECLSRAGFKEQDGALLIPDVCPDKVDQIYELLSDISFSLA